MSRAPEDHQGKYQLDGEPYGDKRMLEPSVDAHRFMIHAGARFPGLRAWRVVASGSKSGPIAYR